MAATVPARYAGELGATTERQDAARGVHLRQSKGPSAVLGPHQLLVSLPDDIRRLLGGEVRRVVVHAGHTAILLGLLDL